MRAASIKPGDIIEASVRGVTFYALIEEELSEAQRRSAISEFVVRPIDLHVARLDAVNAAYRRVRSTQITEHWRRSRRAAAVPQEAGVQ